MMTLTNHWRPLRSAKTGFERFNRDLKGKIEVLGTIECDLTGDQCKCGGNILRITSYRSIACGKCCAGLGQS